MDIESRTAATNYKSFTIYSWAIILIIFESNLLKPYKQFRLSSYIDVCLTPLTTSTAAGRSHKDDRKPNMKIKKV